MSARFRCRVTKEESMRRIAALGLTLGMVACASGSKATAPAPPVPQTASSQFLRDREEPQAGQELFGSPHYARHAGAVYFDYDAATLSEDAKSILREQAEMLRKS